jgi:cell division transport system permease protein
MSFPLKLYYSSQDAYQNVRANLLTAALSAFTVGFSLSIFALFAIVFMNLGEAVKGFGDRTLVVAYLSDDARRMEPEGLYAALRSIPGVKDAEYVSSEAALQKLKSDLAGHEAVFAGIGDNLLPASFEIKVSAEYRDSRRILEVVNALRRMRWVAEVQYGQEWMEKAAALMRFFEFGALLIGAFLAAAALFIISNTIRLTVYARRDEIIIMRLIGASGPYIKIPFLIEGVFMGFLGGLMASGLLTLFKHLFASKLPPYLAFLAANPAGGAGAVFAALVLAGSVLGALGSLFSLGRFLKE